MSIRAALKKEPKYTKDVFFVVFFLNLIACAITTSLVCDRHKTISEQVEFSCRTCCN